MAHISKLLLAGAILAAAIPASAQTADYPMAKTYSSVEEALAAATTPQTSTVYSEPSYAQPIYGQSDQGMPIQSIEIYEQPLPVSDSYTAPASTGQIYTYESPTATYSYAAPQTSGFSASSYSVVRGDTLYAIAGRHGVKVSALMNANGLSSSAINPGQVLQIPAPSQMPTVSQGQTQFAPTQTNILQVPAYNNSVTTAVQRNITDLPGASVYAVLPGDTLYSIAKNACISVTAIAQSSGISATSILSPGQRLTLPARNC